MTASAQPPAAVGTEVETTLEQPARPLRASSAPRSALRDLEPVQRQILCRSINEAIYRAPGGAGFQGEIELVCECTQPSCLKSIRGSRQAYENVRRFPTRFLVKPGHFDRDSERVVEQTDRFVVIEKFGPDAETVIRADSRSRLAPIPNSGPQIRNGND